MKTKNIIANNLGLKLLAFLLAFVTWLYIGEATKAGSEQTVLQKLFSSSQYGSQKLYVKPVFVGKVPDGYKFRKGEVRILPEFIVFAGPLKSLEKKDFISTKPIDLSENTKSKTFEVDLVSPSSAIKLQKTTAQIYLPIEKTEDKKTEE